MITPETSRDIQTFGEIEESYFGIDDKDLRYIFTILRNGVYSNKALAIIREYMTNAQDAHVEIGKPDLPIKVTLPTTLDPRWRVRDFGPGLSKEDMVNVFTKYGKSTKTNSNSFVGHLGLGSKSAFCYADAFQIISYQNGTQRVYNAYLDETHIGKINLITELETDEPNGLEIIITIVNNDLSNFENTFCNFVVTFLPKPDIQCNDRLKSVIESSQLVFTLRGKEWGVVAGESGNKVIMGNIPYLVDTHQINNMTFKNSDVKSWLLDGYAGAKYFMLPIGSVSHTTSRESLEYNKRTVGILVEFFEECFKDYCNNLIETLDNCPSRYEARKLHTRILGSMNRPSYSRGYDYLSRHLGKGKYRNLEPNISLKSILENSNGVEISVMRYDLPWNNKVTKGESYSTIGANASEDIYLLHASTIRNRIPSRMTQYFKTSKDKIRYIYVIDTKGDEKALAHLKSCDEFKGYEWKSVLDLPTEPSIITNSTTTKATSTGMEAINSFILDRSKLTGTASKPSILWTPREDIDPKNDSGVLLKINAFRLDESWLDNNYANLKHVLYYMEKADIPIPEIVGIRSKVDIGNNWISLSKYITNNMSNFDEDFLKQIAFKMSGYIVPKFYYGLAKKTNEIKDEELLKLLESLNHLLENSYSDKVQAVRQLLNYVDRDFSLVNSYKSHFTWPHQLEEYEGTHTYIKLLNNLCTRSYMDVSRIDSIIVEEINNYRILLEGNK